MIEMCQSDNCDREAPRGETTCRRCAAIARGQKAETTRSSMPSPLPHIGRRQGAPRAEWCYEHECPAKYKRTRPEAVWDEPTNSMTVFGAFFDSFVWRPDPDEATLGTAPDRAIAQIAQAKAAAAVKRLQENK